MTQQSATRTTPAGDQRLSARIYETLREWIITGELAPGARLAEQRLAEQLDVSRVPLREAIPQLEVEGFVTSLPRRGAVVSHWSTRAVHDLFDTRLALEPAAAGHAAVRVASGAPTDALVRAQLLSESALASGDELAMAEANAQFHQALVETSQNSLMADLMRAISGRMAWLFYLTRGRDFHLACAEHAQITEVILSGNARLAEAEVYSHIEVGRAASLAAASDAHASGRPVTDPQDPGRRTPATTAAS